MKAPYSAYAPLVAALVAVLAMPVAGPVQAQTDVGVSKPLSAREKNEARIAQQRGKRGQKKAAEAPALYPNATREHKDSQASPGEFKALVKVQELFQADDYAAAIAAAERVAASPDASAYDKSFAYQLAGTAAAQSDDDVKAVQYFEKALATNGLDNNNHYQVMFNLAATQYALEQYDKALTTLDRFMSETKSETPDQLSLRGTLLLNLERYDEAAKLYEGLMAKHPEDKRFMTNAVAAYQQAGQSDKAAELLSKAQASGELTDANQYRALYVGYINADKTAEAIKVIDQGIAKGILTPSPTLAKDYMVLGQKAYYAEDDATAIEMYKRAAPMAEDGEAALNLAKIYADNGKTAEAKAAAKQALEKGVKDTAAAKKLAGSGG